MKTLTASTRTNSNNYLLARPSLIIDGDGFSVQGAEGVRVFSIAAPNNVG